MHSSAVGWKILYMPVQSICSSSGGGEGRVVAPVAEGFSSVDFGYLHPLKTASWSSVACRGPQWPRLWVSAVVARAPRVLLPPFSSARGSHGQGDPCWCWGPGQRCGQSSSRVKVWGVGTCALAVAPGSRIFFSVSLSPCRAWA